MKTLLILGFVFLAVAVPSRTAACGDSLYRVGKGISYREYAAPLPGSVLIYGSAVGASELADELARSGHYVRQVNDELALDIELRANKYDVIIAPYSNHDTVEKRAISAGAAFLPVAENRDQAKTAKSQYANVLDAEHDEIKHYLKAIHEALTLRNT